MARGRKTSLTISLTPAQRQTLLAWQRATIVPSGVSRRARIILLLAEGRSITTIAATVGISRRFVYKWVQRFLEQGVAGLVDKPGRGRRPHQASLQRRPQTPAVARRWSHGAEYQERREIAPGGHSW